MNKLSKIGPIVESGYAAAKPDLTGSARGSRRRPQAPSARRNAAEATGDRLEKRPSLHLVSTAASPGTGRADQPMLMVRANPEQMLHLRQLAMKEGPSDLEREVAQIEECFASHEVPEENDWRTLPHIMTRHDLAEAKRLAKLINPDRWREIFLNYCSALLSLRNVRPAQWAQRDEALHSRWWRDPWFYVASSDEQAPSARAISLGFKNVVSPRVLESANCVFELDLDPEVVGDLSMPETLQRLFILIGTHFNQGLTGHLTKNASACPREVYALLKLFVRRCSDKGVLFDSVKELSNDYDQSETPERIARGSLFAWNESSNAIRSAVYGELAKPLSDLLTHFSRIPKNAPAYARIDESHSDHAAASIFASFMLPVTPMITSTTVIDENTQAFNVQKIMNELWKNRPSLRSLEVCKLETNNESVFAVVKRSQDDEEGDVLLLLNLSHNEASFELRIPRATLKNGFMINSGKRDTVSSVQELNHDKKSAFVQFCLPGHGIGVATIKLAERKIKRVKLKPVLNLVPSR